MYVAVGQVAGPHAAVATAYSVVDFVVAVEDRVLAVGGEHIRTEVDIAEVHLPTRREADNVSARQRVLPVFFSPVKLERW